MSDISLSSLLCFYYSYRRKKLSEAHLSKFLYRYVDDFSGLDAAITKSYSLAKFGYLFPRQVNHESFIIQKIFSSYELGEQMYKLIFPHESYVNIYNDKLDPYDVNFNTSYALANGSIHLSDPSHVKVYDNFAKLKNQIHNNDQSNQRLSCKVFSMTNDATMGSSNINTFLIPFLDDAIQNKVQLRILMKPSRRKHIPTLLDCHLEAYDHHLNLYISKVEEFSANSGDQFTLQRQLDKVLIRGDNILLIIKKKKDV